MAKQGNNGISWTDATWNPLRGCSRVSEGCRHCYAQRVAYRFSGAGQPYEGLAHRVNGEPNWTGVVRLAEDKLLEPLRWKKPRRIFVNSMSDLFHESVPDAWIDRVFAVMALCPQHTFQVLTKRPERMLAYLNNRSVEERTARASVLIIPNEALSAKGIEPDLQMEAMAGWANWPLPNVHLGVSIENPQLKGRLGTLRLVPASCRFLSLEPLLADLGTIALDGIDWVIVGGESGKGARPMHPDWVRSLRDQCVAAGVPFFFKQWGEWLPLMQRPPAGTNPTYTKYTMLHCDGSQCAGGSIPEHTSAGVGYGMARVGKKAAGALLDGREWKEFPR